jgi:hypothetical protein
MMATNCMKIVVESVSKMSCTSNIPQTMDMSILMLVGCFVADVVLKHPHEHWLKFHL